MQPELLRYSASSVLLFLTLCLTIGKEENGLKRRRINRHQTLKCCWMFILNVIKFRSQCSNYTQQRLRGLNTRVSAETNMCNDTIIEYVFLRGRARVFAYVFFPQRSKVCFNSCNGYEARRRYNNYIILIHFIKIAVEKL